MFKILLISISLHFTFEYGRGAERFTSEFLIGHKDKWHVPIVNVEVGMPVMHDGCEIILTITATPHDTTPYEHPSEKIRELFFKVKHPNFEDEFQMLLLNLRRKGFIVKERTICFSRCTNISNTPIDLAAQYNKTDDDVINVKIEAREGRHNCEKEQIKTPDVASSGFNFSLGFTISVIVNLVLICLLVFLYRKYRMALKTPKDLGNEDVGNDHASLNCPNCSDKVYAFNSDGKGELKETT